MSPAHHPAIPPAWQDLAGLLPDSIELAALDFEFLRRGRGEPETPVQIGIATTLHGVPAPEWLWGACLNPLWRTQRGSLLAASAPVLQSDGTARRVPHAGQLEQPPGLLECWPELLRRLGGRVLLAHGAEAEKRMLRAFPGHPFRPWLDTLRLARVLLPHFKKHTLSALCTALGVEHRLRQAGTFGDWHDAPFDAAACLVLFLELLKIADLPKNLTPEQWLAALSAPKLA